MTKRRIVLGISGASGFQYGYKALQLLQDIENVETHLVVSKGAEMARALETPYTKERFAKWRTSSIPSAIWLPVVAPCSMRTLAAVAHGYSDNLLTRAADVVLKERRRLVLMVRETPLNLAHLDNMRRVTEMGGIIFPPVPALYLQPQSVDDILTHSVSRALDLLGIDIPHQPRWGDDAQSVIEN